MKYALLSYVTAPFRFPADYHLQFSNPGVARSMLRVLLKMGYEVDVCEWSDISYCSHKNYDLFIGHGGRNWEYLTRNVVPNAVKIYFSTGTYWKEHNRAEKERFDSLHARRGVKLPYDRWITHSEEFANHEADGIICLGNQHVLETYRKFPLCVAINNGVYSDNHFEKNSKDYAVGRKRFVFFGGMGSVHKGLDRLIEAFAGLDAELFCTGDIEPHFIKVYELELRQHRNIKPLGWITLKSPDFYTLMNACNFVIFPSCAEGQPGSVLECMNQGLIPIVSRESNVDVHDCGIMLERSSSDEIAAVVNDLMQRPVEWHHEHSLRARHAILQRHSEEEFCRTFQAAVENILIRAPEVRTQRAQAAQKAAVNTAAYLADHANDLGALVRGANVLKQAGNAKAAMVVYKAAHELEPACITALVELVHTSIVRGDLGRAHEFVRQIYPLSPFATQRTQLLNELQEKFKSMHAAEHAVTSHQAATPHDANSSPQRILIDGVIFQLQAGHPLGISRLWSSLLPQLKNAMHDCAFTLLCREGFPISIPEFEELEIPAYNDHSASVLDANDAILAEIGRQLKPTLFLSTHYSYMPGVPNVLMMYDLIPEVMGFDLNQKHWIAKERAIARAHSFLSISKSTRYDLARVYNIPLSRIGVAYPGISPDFRPASRPECDAFLRKYGIAKPYFLIVGNRDLYKSCRAFLHAFSVYPGHERMQVLMIGGDSKLLPDESPYASFCNIQLLPWLPDDELRAAYSSAVALIYLSRYEGFGLPVAEAMASGCAVITTKIASLPEVGGDAVLYVHPDMPREILAGLHQLHKQGVREAMIRRGLERASKFTWQNMARVCAQKLRQVVGSSSY